MTKIKTSLLPVYFVFFLDNFGFGLVFAIFGPLILNPEFGMLSPGMTAGERNIFLGILFAAFPLTQLFGAPIVGDIADRFGRKKAFYITILGTTLGYILSGAAITFHSYSFLFFSRLVTGFFAGNLSICLASIADLSPDEESRAKNYGMISTLGGVSWILSMLIGGFLSDPKALTFANPSIPFFLTAI
ncbi:MAG: MFS transporter, partial [Simkaniaceae bacterium]|nr:MFS transporter [Simkaniaceae bacterium]